MRTSSLLIGAGLLGLLAGCNRSSDTPSVGSGNGVWVNQDFESLRGWSNPNNATSLTSEKAHSGKFSIKTGPGIEYSMGFGAKLGDLSSTKPRKLHLEAWVWVPSEKSTSSLVVQVGSGDKPVMWESIKLAEKAGGFGEWKKLETDIMMKPEITYTDGLSVYMWGPQETAPVYLDDLVITEAE